MRKFLAATVLVFLSVNSALAFDHTYPKWGQVLAKYVVRKDAATQVKYFDLKKNSQLLDDFILEASSVKMKEYNTWSDNQKLAFLFNSYNALTIKHILNNHSEDKPLSSIKKIGGFFGNAWKMKFFQFLGEESHLDHVEQDLARPSFDEPRMHFAFNCASKGCPALGTYPFLPEKLDAQLNEATRLFLNDKDRNSFDDKSGSIYLSSIFKWYKGDFEKSKKFKSLNEFLAKHMLLADPVKDQLLNGKIKIKYLEYDWSLNTADK